MRTLGTAAAMIRRNLPERSVKKARRGKKMFIKHQEQQTGPSYPGLCVEIYV